MQTCDKAKELKTSGVSWLQMSIHVHVHVDTVALTSAAIEKVENPVSSNNPFIASNNSALESMSLFTPHLAPALSSAHSMEYSVQCMRGG